MTSTSISANQSSEILEAIKNKALCLDPLAIISLCAFTFYMNSPDDLPSDEGKLVFLQHHLEFFQAVLLQNKRSDFGSNKATIERVREISRLFVKLETELVLERQEVLKKKYGEGNPRINVLENMRITTQAFRNWIFPQYLKKMALELFSPLEAKVLRDKGYSLAAVIEMCFNLLLVLEKKSNLHHDWIYSIWSAETHESALKNFGRIGIPVDQGADFIQKVKKLKLDDFKWELINFANRFLVNHLTFSVQDLTKFYEHEISEELLSKIIDGWSFEFGDLKQDDASRFLLSNPVWKKPFIKLEENRYFLPIPQLFLSFLLDLISGLFQSDRKLFESFNEKRSQYLEDSVESLFKQKFPNSHVFVGCKWENGYENDLLLVEDCIAIIVEDKSGRVHESAKRGGEGRLKRVIDDLLIEPSIQSQRLAEELMKNRKIHKFVDKYQKAGQIDSSKLRNIIRVNVSLEPVWVITGAMPQLSLAEFAPSDLQIPVTVTLNQLELLFQILPSGSQTLHYLRRRSILESKIEYLGDELEWLGLYLKNALLFDESKVDDKIVKVLGNSDEVRRFLMDQFKKRSAKKPLLPLNKWWKDLLSFIERKRMENWTEIADCLLNVPLIQQNQFEKEFEKLRWQAYEDKSKQNIKTYIQSGGESPNAKYLLGGLCYYRISKKRVEEELGVLGSLVMEKGDCDSAVVIGVDVDNRQQPCDFIRFIRREHENLKSGGGR